MKAYMFNKGLPILFYCDNESLLKIRQLSTQMRKRVFYIIRDKKVIVNKDCDVKAKNLNGWVYLSKNHSYAPGSYNSELHKPYPVSELIQKRIANAEVGSREELLEIFKTLPELRCSFRNGYRETETKRTFPIHFNRVDNLYLNKKTIELMENDTFDQIDEIVFFEEDEWTITKAISRIKRVAKLTIDYEFIDLSCLNWTNSLKILSISNLIITKEFELPSLTEIHAVDCQDFSKLKCPKLDILFIHSYHFNYDPNEIAGFISLKTLELNWWNLSGKEYLLPKGLRRIFCLSGSRMNGSVDIQLVLKQCPSLLSFEYKEHKIDLAKVQGTNLKEVCLLGSTALTEESTLRLRKAVIDDSNYALFHKHPEIISETKHFEIDSFYFDWKFLPDGYKVLCFSDTIAIEEGMIDENIDKLRGAKIKSITLENSSSARKILETAFRVELIICSDQLEDLDGLLKEHRCKTEKVRKEVKTKKCCMF